MGQKRTFVSDEERAIAVAHGDYEEAVLAGFKRSYNSWSSIRSTEAAHAAVSAALDGEPEGDTVGSLGAHLPPRTGSDDAEWYAAIKEFTRLQAERVDRPRTIEHTFTGQQWVGVVFIGDIHVGGMIEYEQLDADIDTIRETPGLYAVGTGDYGDFFGSQPKLTHALVESTLPNSNDELDLIAHVLGRGNTDAGSNWLALGTGNHDAWAGERSVELLCDRLGAKYFSQAGCALKCTVGGQRYVGYVKHQWRGHSNINTSNGSRRFWDEFPEWENADFTVMAHYHQPDTHQVQRKGNDVAYLRGGTYKTLDYYAEKAGYTPQYGPALVLLNPDDHEVVPFHGPLWKHGVQYLKQLRGEL